MKHRVAWPTGAALALVFVLASTTASGQKKTQQDAPPRTRTFRLDYGGTLEGLPEGTRVRVWLPVPQSSEHQKVRTLELDLPDEAKISVEPTYGNKILYFETQGPPSGTLPFNVSYRIHRREVRGLSGGGSGAKLTEAQRERFLSANTKVPISGQPLRILEGMTFPVDPLALARSLYDRVGDFVRYDKSEPGYGNGDVLWVCNSRFGNCTDFHSLFLSLSRAKGLPTRFEIGLPLPAGSGEGTIGGYHCWAWFHTDAKGWVPVDVSEADKQPQMKEYYFGNLTEHRLSLTTGRDIELVPKQDGEPLNYFVYPYVEVKGKPWPKEKMELSFTYADLERESSP